MTDYQQIASTAKTWVYQSSTKIEDSQVTAIEERLIAFTDNWAAHGNKLTAFAKVFHNRFIVIMVDENVAAATGCSIDSSVHLIKEIESSFGLNLFDRLKIAYLNKENEVNVVSKKELNDLLETETITDETIIFNNMIQTKAQFEKQWKIALKESWLKTVLA